ncbi:MAG: hypothetical protein KAV87_33550 [Desulfobacteraceae bacterium]|nr:hypothetical protein [Desulfobacteraceae bacterium]
MNFRIALRLASILSLAEVRGKRASGSIPTRRSKAPLTYLSISPLLLVISAVVVYFLIKRGGENPILTLLYTQLMVFFPSLTAFMSMVYSIQFEFSQSIEAASTDMINWLPIAPTDYVLGSTLTTMYSISQLLAVIFGGFLGAAIYVGRLDLWAVGSLMGILGSLIGAFTLEIIRPLMNRLSHAFLKGRGQFAMITRTVLTLMLLVLVQLVFNPTILMKIASWFSVSILDAWFIPLLWPSLTMLRYIFSDVMGTLIFAGLSSVLLLVVFLGGVKARAMNWVPTPVSYRLKPVEFKSSKRGILGCLGFSVFESALIRKDFKSLIRRRETLTPFVIPVMITLTFLIAQSGMIGGSAPPEELRYSILGLMLFNSVILGLSVSIISLGQEGGAFHILQITPLEPRSITRAKVLHAFIPSLLLMSLTFLAIFSLIGDPVITAGAFLLGITGVFDVIIVSMIIGAHYVDFTEVPRHRFVRWEGTLIAFLALFALLGVILSPFIVGLLKPEFALKPQVAFVISEVIATAVAYLGYRRAVEEVSLIYNSEDL